LDRKLKKEYYRDVCQLGKNKPKISEVERYQELYNRAKPSFLKIDGLLKGETKKVFCTVNHKL
jgi:hypothetical protein